MMTNLVQAKVSRWMEILSNLDKLGFLTTSNIQQLHNLGGRRNTTRILNDMGDLLNSFRMEETVWYLSAKGRKEIDSNTVRRRTLQIHHTLMRNSVYVAYRPDLWKPEYNVKWADKCVIADAIFIRNGNYVFLEIDHTQSMAVNERKIELYRELRETQLFQKKYGQFPLIMYVTVSEHRQKKLRGLLDGMKADILTIDDFK